MRNAMPGADRLQVRISQEARDKLIQMTERVLDRRGACTARVVEALILDASAEDIEAIYERQRGETACQ